MSDGRLRRVKLKFERDYTQIPNEWLRDPQLSLRARGLLAMLMSHAEGFVVTQKMLAATNPEGAAAIQAAVDELKREGYLMISKVRGRGGRIAGWEWDLTDPAEQKTRSQPQLDLPDLERPDLAEPRLDNHALKEAHSKEHLSLVNETLGSTHAGAQRDGLTADVSRPQLTLVETAGERWQRMLHAKCPKRPKGGEHIWPVGERYCYWCAAEMPSSVDIIVHGDES